MIAWIAVALETRIAVAGAPAERRHARSDPFSDRSLAKTVARIVPLVERAAGRPFLTPPVVALATPEVLAKMLREEQSLIEGSVLRDTPAEIRAAGDAGLDPGIDTSGLLGKYGVFEKTLYLCSASITDATIGSGLPPDAVADVASIVLAHELTHALHDQYSDLAGIVRGLPDQDALWSAASTWEGLATWVSQRVAVDLDATDTWTFLAALQGWSPTGLEEKTAYPVWAMYGRGRDAIAWHFDHGGFDEVWAVASHPPAASRGVFRPASWADPRPVPPIDYPAVLRGTEQVLTEGPWIVGISVLGEFQLRGEAVVGDNEATIDEILGHLTDAWALAGTRDDRRGEVRILVFDGPSWPQRYLDALRVQVTADAALLASRVGREVEVEYQPFDAVAGDAAITRSSRVAGAGGTVTERHAAWVVRGSTVVVVTAEAFRPGLRLGWTVDEVFRRLDAARTP